MATRQAAVMLAQQQQLQQQQRLDIQRQSFASSASLQSSGAQPTLYVNTVLKLRLPVC